MDEQRRDELQVGDTFFFDERKYVVRAHRSAKNDPRAVLQEALHARASQRKIVGHGQDHQECVVGVDVGDS